MTAPTNTANIIQNARNLKAQQKDNQGRTLRAALAKMAPEISKALPATITPERFSRIALTAISSNPQLAECTQTSFLGSLMQAAQLGLEPNTPLGQAYLIPFRNGKKNVTECQFQLGYKGLIDLVYRSGEVTTVSAHEVYENDEFSYTLGLEPTLVHKPAMANRGEVIAYYAVFRTVKGGFGFEVMSKEDVERHARKYSQAFSSGPWQTNFDEMAKKTVLKKCLKYAPVKSEFLKAVAADGTIKTEITPDMVDQSGEPVDYEVDPETGEVTEPAGQTEQKEGGTE